MLAVLLLLLVPVARPQDSASTVDIWLSGFQTMNGFMNGNYLYMGLHNSCSDEPRGDVANTPGLVCYNMPYYKILYPAGTFTDSDESFYLWYDSWDRQWLITSGAISISRILEARALDPAQQPQQVYSTALLWDESDSSEWNSCSTCQVTTTPPGPTTTTAAPTAAPTTIFEPLHCVACDAGFFRDQPTKTCTACPPGSSTFPYSNASSPLHCLCRPGFENTSEACGLCRSAFFKGDLENSSCTQCHPDSQSPTPGAIARGDCLCHPGFFFALDEHGEKSCEACEAGTYKGDLADVLCTECPPDHFCLAGANETQTCPLHSFSAAGSARVEECLCFEGFFFDYSTGRYACHACAPGTYTDRAGQPSCTSCPANTYNPHALGSSADACRSCAPNSASPPGSSAEVNCSCNLGYAGEPGDSCAPCAPGQYRENSAVYICEACPANTFSHRVAAESSGFCGACPLNTSSGAGSGSERDCVCDPGLYADADLSCAPCARGKFSTSHNSTSCVACDPGKFSAALGAASGETCLACPPGSYGTGSGMTACMPCPPSTWQNASVLAQRARECTACPAHSSHGAQGATDVFACQCAAGFWKRPVSPAFECSECLAGHFCPGSDELLPCPFDTFATGGLLTACTPCAPFSKATANASLTGPEQCQCSPGASGAFHSDCTPCAAGYFQAKDHAHGGADALQAQLGLQEESGATVGAPAARPTVCVPCAEHTFQNTTGSTACHACPAHSSTEGNASADATQCKCDPGHFGVSGQTCDLCHANNFCPGATVMNPCRVHASAGTGARAEDECTCISGFYSAAPAGLCSLCPPSMYCPGDLAVLACANASSSDAGAQGISACACFAGHWRGCIKNATGFYIDNSHLPCTIDYATPCFLCEPNDICFNETLKHCPRHSTAPPGSDDDRDCVCDPGYLGLYGRGV